MAVSFPRFGLQVFMVMLLLPWMRATAQSQGDTLKTINIQSKKQEIIPEVKNQFATGQQKLDFDSTILKFYRELSLSELLTDQSPVFVKTYGVNSMATLSIRGASAAQSTVLWNGVPINNAALGLSDISLLNGSLFNNISLQYGGSSALLGSANVGGALLLEDNSPTFRNGQDLALTLATGSYGHYEGLLRSDWQNEHWHISLKVFGEQSKNDFSYQNLSGQTQKMDNARLSGGGGVLNVDHLFKQSDRSSVERQTISFKLWIQDYSREIPPALFEAFSVKQEQDFALHSLINWEQKRKRSLFYAKLAYSRQDMNYEDGVVLPENKNRVNQIYQETGWKWDIISIERNPKWLQDALLFIPVEYSWANGENIAAAEKQFRPAIAAAYKIHNATESVNLNFAFRTEWWDNRQPAYLPGLSGRFRIFSKSGNVNLFSVALLGNIQRAYRVPTLNELYFSPGGNPDLKPERGWNQDGGFILEWNLKENQSGYLWKLSNQTSFFNRNIKDWIYWLGGAIWTPHNLAAVHSRGVETNSSIRFHQNKITLVLSLKTAYVLATTTRSYLPNDGSIGSQIPYTPRYNESGFLSFSYKNLYLNYNQNYTGYRFITTDESQFLKPFQTGNLMASYTFNRLPFGLTISGQLRNIWNRRYEVVSGRPMPGRNFLLSVTVERKKGT